MHRRQRLILRRLVLRRLNPRHARALLAPLAVLTLISGCSRAVEVAPPDRSDSPACANLPWPLEVSGLGRTATRPTASWVAAWGDPAVIARCGLPALEPTGLECVGVDGVDWIIRELDGGTAMSTYGTDPALEVLVPTEHGPGPLLLPAFTQIARSLPQTGQHCT